MEPTAQSQSHATPLPTPESRGQWHKDFTDVVNGSWKKGIDGDKNAVSYFCLGDQRTYWEAHLVGVLQACNITADADTILPPQNQNTQQSPGYTKIWSTLSYIGQPQFIDYFISEDWDDASLPLKEASTGRNNPFNPNPTPQLLGMLHNFYEYQWIFNPLQLYQGRDFLFKRRLESKHIIPVQYEKEISPKDNWGNCSVYLVLLNENCSDLSRIVFKEYTGVEAAPFYNREVTVLNSFGVQGDPYIVKYFGSFEQNERRVVMLEYLKDGTLADFFEKADRPTTPDQVEKLFNALFGLSMGLFRLKDEKYYTHGDLKPRNIFVTKNSSEDPYDISLKLADFDRSSKLNSETPRDNDMSLTYSSPEESSVYPFEFGAGIRVSSNGDIWSLGAIISEALVWCYRGRHQNGGLASYRDVRNKELQNIHGMEGSGYDACFHNGQASSDGPRLRCIDAVHDEALRYKMPEDYVSDVVRRCVEKYMLVGLNLRLPPKPLYHHYNQDLLESKKGFHGRAGQSGSPSSPDPGVPMVPTSMPRTRPSFRVDSCVPEVPRTQSIQDRGSFVRGGVPQQVSPSTPIREAHRSLPINPPGSTPVWETPGPSHHPHRMPSHFVGTTPANAHTRHQSQPDHSSYGPDPVPAIQPSWGDNSLGLGYSAMPNASIASRRTTPPRGRVLHPRYSTNAEQSYSIATLPWLSLQDVIACKEEKGKKLDSLPGYTRAWEAIRLISQPARDIVFLIDDSGSMAKLLPQVRELAKALLILTKAIDRDGADLYFTSRPDKSFRSLFKARIQGSALYLLEDIDSQYRNANRGACNMEHALDILLTKLYSKGQPTSLYVLTDGIWDPKIAEAGGGAEGPIRRIAERMKEDRRSRTDLTIQFIRFDNPSQPPERQEMSRGRLQHLDDFLSQANPEAFENGNYDMVDHKYCEDSMWDQLLGAIFKSSDNKAAGGELTPREISPRHEGFDSFPEPDYEMANGYYHHLGYQRQQPPPPSQWVNGQPEYFTESSFVSSPSQSSVPFPPPQQQQRGTWRTGGSDARH